MIADGAFYALDAPVKRLGALDVPVPFSPPLEDVTVPTPETVAADRAPNSAGKEADDGDPNATGRWAVDWEQRADFDRLRRERLARAKAEHLERSDLGALLCFDMANIRYITATHIGTWAIDKLDPLLPAHARRRADHVGLRLRGAAPQALHPVA